MQDLDILAYLSYVLKQENYLVKDFKLYKISTGDLLREEIKNSTDLGNKIKSIMDKGLLVSDDIINNLIENVVSNEKVNNRLIVRNVL